ncbi:MAG: methyltransferase family protein [Microgenomates group bacterium Gr01-1014_7]|nr:MAG: methyltransferase family protein [Microgenomates group bacterium Gr01-1014_7]
MPLPIYNLKMIKLNLKSVFGTGGSAVVENCQICNNSNLKSVLFLGYLPPVNQLHPIGSKPKEQPSYPAELLYCSKCHLVQLGLAVDPQIIFPKEYPYTSGTTKVLRDNFADLGQEVKKIIGLHTEDLVVDIGSNDGTLLSNFVSYAKVLGVTPEDIGKLAIEKNIPTVLDYFRPEVVDKIKKKYGKAKVVTAANVFAHIEDVNGVLDNIVSLLQTDGVFISESHYLYPLIRTVQYDTIYHEHLRYYSLTSLSYLLKKHGLEIFHAKQIPSHGGSIRVYAAKKGLYSKNKSVTEILAKEKEVVTSMDSLLKFKDRVVLSKLGLQSLLFDIKKKRKTIFGISAPSRASTLINYLGLDQDILDCVVEIKGSYKIGKYIPGTKIPILEESILFKDQPDYALLLSWHIAEELIPKLKQRGFRGKFIIPLPEPRIV